MLLMILFCLIVHAPSKDTEKKAQAYMLMSVIKETEQKLEKEGCAHSASDEVTE